MKSGVFNWKYALVIAAVIVLIFAVMDFNNRVTSLRRLRAKHEVVAAELEGLQQTQTYLATQKAYVASDQGVIQWAYEEGHMRLPQDVPVVIVAQPGVTPEPASPVVVTQSPVSYWQMWLWYFFGPVATLP